MRQPVTTANLQLFIKALAASVTTPSRIFLVGGATSVMLGWRTSTIDIDLKIIPESDEILRSLPVLKERLQLNIELASPGDFIPELPGWEDRSRFIQQEGKLSFYHYDFYAQALAKIERGHRRDREDVDQMIKNNLVDPVRLLQLFSAIEDHLYLAPSLNPASFRRDVERIVREYTREQ